MARSLYWYASCYTLCTINILLHSFGFLLLLIICRRGRKSAQDLILLNLAAVEVLKNLTHLMNDVNHQLRYYDERTPFRKKFHDHIQLIRSIWLLLQFYCIMFILTGDRLMHCFLGIRYSLIFTFRRVHILLKVTWIANFIPTLCFCIVYEITGYHRIDKIFYHYVDMGLGMLFVVFATTTYIYMFWKYRQSSLNTQTSGMDKERVKRLSNMSLLRNSKFSIAIVLVVSFLLLTVMPDTWYTICIIRKDKSRLFPFFGVSKLLSDTTDAIVYILLKTSVRSLLYRMLCSTRGINGCILFRRRVINDQLYLEESRISPRGQGVQQQQKQQEE